MRIEHVPEPDFGPTDLLLRTATVGICGTDAHEYSHGPSMFPLEIRHPISGHLGPMIPGHEFSGYVEQIGSDVHDFAVGDLVVSGAGVSCGACDWCKLKRTNLCARYYTVGLHRNGALAELVSVPAATCVNATSSGLSADAAALGQPMSIAVHAFRRSGLESGQRAIIIGAGGIGAFLTYVVSQAACPVLTLDTDSERLAIAARLGASQTLDPVADGAGLVAQARDSDFVHTIFEVSGTRAGFELALNLSTRGTRVVLVGLQDARIDIDVRDLSLRELELIGTNAHVVSTDLPEALRLLTSRTEGWADVAPEVLGLDDLVGGGLEPLANRSATRIKTLIDPSGSTVRPSS